MIDAASYGLSASASAADNQHNLHAAIANADGAPVYIADGTYETAPITITKPNTTLILSPNAILKATSTSALVNIRADNVTVEGGQFDGGGKESAAGIMAIRINGSYSHITIRYCTIRNASTGIGAYNVTGGSDWTFANNVIHTTTRSHGICLHGKRGSGDNVHNVAVRENTIYGAKGNGIWIGIGYSHAIVMGNRVENSGRMGIEVWSNPKGHFVIANNFVKDCASFGISISGTPHVICSGNDIEHVMSYGIEVAGSRYVTLAGNHIESVSAKEGGAKPVGIVLNSTQDYAVGDIAIQGGIISDSHAGINICGDRGKRDNIAITGVVIRNCEYGIRNVGQSGRTDGGGIVEHLAINGCAIHAKTIGIGNSLYGGLMRGGIINGNNIYVTEGNGIDLFRPAEVAIVGNRICGDNKPGTVGIQLRDHEGGTLRAHDLLVESNHVVRFWKGHLYSPMIAQAMATALHGQLE